MDLPASLNDSLQQAPGYRLDRFAIIVAKHGCELFTANAANDVVIPEFGFHQTGNDLQYLIAGGMPQRSLICLK